MVQPLISHLLSLKTLSLHQLLSKPSPYQIGFKTTLKLGTPLVELSTKIDNKKIQILTGLLLKKNRQGSFIKQHKLTNYIFTFNQLINEPILIPGWNPIIAPKANLVLATKLSQPCSPTLKKALQPQNQDTPTWKASYMEEYNSLTGLDVYDEITWDDFKKIQHKCGRPISTIYVLIIKYKNGYPDRAKSCIVVLGDQQQVNYQPDKKYAPVLTQTQFRVLLSMAIKNKQYLRQGDVKNIFL